MFVIIIIIDMFPVAEAQIVLEMWHYLLSYSLLELLVTVLYEYIVLFIYYFSVTCVY